MFLGVFFSVRLRVRHCTAFYFGMFLLGDVYRAAEDPTGV